MWRLVWHATWMSYMLVELAALKKIENFSVKSSQQRIFFFIIILLLFFFFFFLYIHCIFFSFFIIFLIILFFSSQQRIKHFVPKVLALMGCQGIRGGSTISSNSRACCLRTPSNGRRIFHLFFV